MNLKDYMKAKKEREGKKHGSTKRKRKNHNHDSQGK